MRTAWITIVAAGLLCSIPFCSAQNSTSSPSSSSQTDTAMPKAQQAGGQPAAPGEPNGVPRIAAGSVIPVQLAKTIDAKKVKTGDEIEVKVAQDMKAQSGQILLAKDTMIVGHVTESQARTKDQKESQLGIIFDHAVLKEGGTVPLSASIQAVIVPPSQNSDSGSAYGSGVGAQSGSGSRTATPGPAGAGGGPPLVPPPIGGQSGASAGNAPNPPITSSTQGVIGISNYKLSTPGDVTQGSVVSSEKSNVKLESGTLMLLRVNP